MLPRDVILAFSLPFYLCFFFFFFFFFFFWIYMVVNRTEPEQKMKSDDKNQVRVFIVQ